MDIVRAFIGVHGFQVHHVANDVKLFGNTVSAVHITSLARNIERLSDIVPLHDRYHVRRETPFIDQSAHSETRLQPQRDLAHHVGELWISVGAEPSSFTIYLLELS